MKIRQGRKNPHTLYLQMGDNPDSEKDISIGYIRFPRVAEQIVELCNGGVVRKRTFVEEAEFDRTEELRPDRLGPSEDDVQVNAPDRPSRTLG